MSHDIASAMQQSGSGVLALPQGEVDVLRLRKPVAETECARADLPTADSDEALVSRVRAGDQDAFALLIARYQDRIYTLAYSFVRESDDALDLVQETFVKAYRGIERFRGSASFYTWLYRIAVNTCKDHLRKRGCRPAISLEDDQLQESGYEPVARDRHSDPVGVAETKELRTAVHAAVSQLPEKLRTAIVLHDIQGLPQQEVAAIMNCPLGTVKSHVFRGRTQLRKMLGCYVEGEE